MNEELQYLTLYMVIKMDKNYSIGERVKGLRVKYQLSQEQLALQAEITTAYLGQVERGEKNPTVVTVEKICNALDISLSDFFNNQKLQSSEGNDAALKQIAFELKNCSPAQKQEILQIIKHAIKLKDL